MKDNFVNLPIKSTMECGLVMSRSVTVRPELEFWLTKSSRTLSSSTLVRVAPTEKIDKFSNCVRMLGTYCMEFADFRVGTPFLLAFTPL